MMLEFRPGSTDCRQIEALLPPFVDGAAKEADAARVRAHLDRCDVCRAGCEAQRRVRLLLRDRYSALCGTTPPGLDARLRALSSPATQPTRMGVAGRMSALAAAASLVLVAGGVLMWGTERSSVLLAAQLTLDHIKCFMIDGDDQGEKVTAETAEAQMQAQHGVTVHLPAATRDDVHVVAVRRCLYGEGLVPHVLYRVDGQPVSLFIMPGTGGSAAAVNVLGRHAEVLVRDGITYVLVSPAQLSGVAAAVGLEAQ